MNILINILPYIISSAILIAIWRQQSLILISPSVFGAFLFFALQIIPEKFRISMPKTPFPDFTFWFVIIFVFILLGLFVCFLRVHNIEWQKIWISQGIQLFTWLFIWYSFATLFSS